MPIKELVSLCKKYDAISIIDAAHGAGIREINLRDIDPDFFYTNFNKWAFCPTGVNMLYMKEKYLN
jgi:selenocysteine lyase/cysteine desulfurase